MPLKSSEAPSRGDADRYVYGLDLSVVVLTRLPLVCPNIRPYGLFMGFGRRSEQACWWGGGLV